jgi:hypothetical protein
MNGLGAFVCVFMAFWTILATLACVLFVVNGRGARTLSDGVFGFVLAFLFSLASYELVLLAVRLLS